MNTPVIIILFICAQIVINITKIIVEQLFIETETGYYIENFLSVLTSVSFYFVLLDKQISPLTCWFSAVGFGIFSFVISWANPRIMDTFIGWGEDDINLNTTFPLINSLILFFVFIPTGLGPSIGMEGLFTNKWSLFLLFLLVEAAIIGLIIFISHYLEDNVVALLTDVFLHISLCLLMWVLVNDPTTPRGYVAVLVFVFLIATTIELIAGLYLSDENFGTSFIDESFWKKRSYIFSSQVSMIAILYIFPLIKKILSFIDSLVS